MKFNFNKKFLIFFGAMIMFGMTLLMASAFYTAYFSPNKVTKVYIDTLGEADIEFYLVLPFVLVSGLTALILSYKELKK